MVLVTFLFNLLSFIFVIYNQNYDFFYNNVICFKKSTNLLYIGYLNNKLFYYYGDVKIQELFYRIQFLLNNFDKIDLKTVKYLRTGLTLSNNNFYNSFYHPHFLVELKNNIDNFNSFYLNFQMSTKSKLGFEKLSNIDLNLTENIQYISPCIRVYEKNTVELLENKYIYSNEFIYKNKTDINNYIFKNLKEYVSSVEILKK